MITLKNEKVSRVINVPTLIDDITPEILKKLSANITLPKYKVLIALCWKVNFSDLFFAKKNNKETQVVPLCAKTNIDKKDIEDFEWLKVGKKVIISRSGIEMGVHIHIPNAASMQSISNWAEEVSRAENPNTKTININALPKGQFILIEFKLVNLSDINGVIESDILSEDPFIGTNE